MSFVCLLFYASRLAHSLFLYASHPLRSLFQLFCIVVVRLPSTVFKAIVRKPKLFFNSLSNLIGTNIMTISKKFNRYSVGKLFLEPSFLRYLFCVTPFLHAYLIGVLYRYSFPKQLIVAANSKRTRLIRRLKSIPCTSFLLWKHFCCASSFKSMCKHDRSSKLLLIQLLEFMEIHMLSMYISSRLLSSPAFGLCTKFYVQRVLCQQLYQITRRFNFARRRFR